MSGTKKALELESTGDPALDRILGGGIPARSVVILGGEPGSGKTILTLQMLFHAARRGKKSLYFTTLSEPAIKVIRYMQLFDFFDLDALDQKITFVDVGAHLRTGPERTLEEIEKRVEADQPSFVVIDSFRAIGELVRDLGGAGRPFIYELAVKMAGWDATTILVGEYTREEYPDFAEFAIADGIIRLGSERQELTSVREMEVCKLRGAAYLSGRHFFDINQAGVSFYPRVSAPVDIQVQPSEGPESRAGTGIAGLDELLDGGIPTGSATVIEGGTGTGKTLLSLQFLIEGARQGQKGVLFTLEETPDQLRSIARTLGWDLAALESECKLVIKYASPVELSTDRFLYEARREVHEMGASRVVFDSLTTMGLGVPSERRYHEMVYAIAKYMRAAGVTLILTVESDQLLGATRLTGDGVSFVSDNLIQLRYVEMEGRLERAISVIKARGIRHSSELRTLTIASTGPQVSSGRFQDLRGVLTGLPVRDPRELR